MAKELRAVEDVRPPHKVTDYSSSSEESGTTDEEEEDVEQEGADDSTSGPEDTRAALVLAGLKGRVFPLGLLPAAAFCPVHELNNIQLLHTHYITHIEQTHTTHAPFIYHTLNTIPHTHPCTHHTTT